MADIFLICPAQADAPGNSYARSEFDRLVAAAGADRVGRHRLVNDPEVADIVLFVGPELATFQDVRRHPLRRKYRDKSFLFFGADRVLPLMPGIYASLQKRDHDRNWSVSGFYPRVAFNENICDFGAVDDCRLLFAFSGAIDNSAVRKAIARLRHPRAHIGDTSHLPVAARQRDGLRGANDEYVLGYVQLLKDSKFILCPRGVGTSSWRLFEAMKAGRAPVILSDEWVAPEGPRWEEFCVRISERDVADVPRRLEALEAQATQMGRAAAAAFQQYFARETMFDTIAEACVVLGARRRGSIGWSALPYYLAMFRPGYFRHWLLADAKRDAIRLLGRKQHTETDGTRA